MDIKDIKAQLTITQVLQHYNLRADKNNKLCCPFHDDKSPSLQIYPATNTYCCFSANCKAATGDAIQFIQLKENCTKHEALNKAASLINGNPITTAPIEAKLIIETEPLEKIAVLTKLFKYFTKSLPLTKKAVDYTESRAINYKVHEIGFNTGDWHHKLNEKKFIIACESYGLLKAIPVKGFTVWGRDCIIFPLKNPENKIVSFYGRSIINNEDHRHFYLSNRSGLYPGYPKSGTKKINTC
jgi:DNA primase